MASNDVYYKDVIHNGVDFATAVSNRDDHPPYMKYVLVDGGTVVKVDLPQYCLYTKLASIVGRPAITVGQSAQTNHLLLTNSVGATKLEGDYYGTMAALVVARENYVIAVQRTAKTWERLVVTPELVVIHRSLRDVPEGAQGSQGMLEFDGEAVTWTDLNRYVKDEKGKIVGVLPCTRGNLILAQAAHSQDVLLFEHGKPTLRHPGFTPVQPRLAVNPHVPEDIRAAISDGTDVPAVRRGAFSAYVPPTTPPPPPPPPPDDEEPPPMFELPNDLAVALEVDRLFPDLLQETRKHADPPDHIRGAFVDQLAHTLNRLHNTDRYGRKARQRGVPASANGDTLTYRLDDNDHSNKRMVDVVIGNTFQPGWSVIPVEEEKDNGYWTPAINPDLFGTQPDEDDDQDPGTTPPPPPPPPTCALSAEVARAIVANQATTIDVLKVLFNKIEVLQQQVTLLNQNIAGMSVTFPEYQFKFLNQNVTLRPVKPKTIDQP